MREVVCYAEEWNKEAAQCYARMVGITGKTRMELVRDGLPYEEIAEMREAGMIPLVVDNAINPALKDRFFGNPQIAHFVDHTYLPGGKHESPVLHTIGTTSHGLSMLGDLGERNLSAMQEGRSAAQRRILGAQALTYVDMERILHSPQWKHIRLHALGPRGTNIVQASEQYLASKGIGPNRGEVVVHPTGIEPMEYAELAAKEAQDRGVLPLHMECAVYYREADLYRDRMREVVFADHHYMPLDEMQLAARQGENEGTVIASHPSPVPLLNPLLHGGYATYQKATSNASAAEAVAAHQADLCITTESGRRRSGLEKIHSFGSPMMIFTIGTPLTNDQLRASLRA